MNRAEYIYRQTQLTVLLLGFIAMFIWGLEPLRKHDRKMQKILHNHKVHHQHFYECNCKY